MNALGPLRRIVAALLLSLGFAMAITASADAETLQQRITRLEPHIEVFRPDAEGRVPIVLMLPGCGGRQPFLTTWAERVNAEGAAAAIIDSHRMRGIGRFAALSTVCTGTRMWGRNRAGDLFAAMAWARAQPWVDQDRIVAAGWSHGSWTIIDALSMRTGAEMRRATGLSDLPEEPLDGLSATFLMYPYAGVASFGGRQWRLTPDSVAIVAGRDYMVGTKTPMAALERARDRGAPLDIHLFPTATHAFDEPEAYDPRVRYDATLTRRAETMMADLLERVMRVREPAPA